MKRKGWDTKKTAMRSLALIAVVLTVLISSFFIFSGGANAALSAPVLKYTLNGQAVNLTWENITNATQYKVYYSMDNSTFFLLGNTTKNYYFYKQPWNTTYYYYVTAANATSESAHSNIVKITTPEQPASGGAGTTTTNEGVTIKVYTPFLWLGVFFFTIGLLMIGVGKSSRKRRDWEGLGVLILILGFLLMLAAVLLPTFHLL